MIRGLGDLRLASMGFRSEGVFQLDQFGFPTCPGDSQSSDPRESSFSKIHRRVGGQRVAEEVESEQSGEKRFDSPVEDPSYEFFSRKNSPLFDSCEHENRPQNLMQGLADNQAEEALSGSDAGEYKEKSDEET